MWACFGDLITLGLLVPEGSFQDYEELYWSSILVAADSFWKVPKQHGQCCPVEPRVRCRQCLSGRQLKHRQLRPKWRPVTNSSPAGGRPVLPSRTMCQVPTVSERQAAKAPPAAPKVEACHEQLTSRGTASAAQSNHVSGADSV